MGEYPDEESSPLTGEQEKKRLELIARVSQAANYYRNQRKRRHIDRLADMAEDLVRLNSLGQINVSTEMLEQIESNLQAIEKEFWIGGE